MTDQEQQTPPKRKKRQASTARTEIELDVSRPTSKDEDFDLNLKEMMYQAKKGQAGSRTKSPEAGGEDPNASRASD